MAPPALTTRPIVRSPTIPPENRPAAVGLMTAFRAFAQDVTKSDNYSKNDQLLLSQAIQQIEKNWPDKKGESFREAILKAQKDFNPEIRKVWSKFLKDHESTLHSLHMVFLEQHPRLLAERQFGLAQEFRKKQFFGAAWTLSKLAERFPPLQPKAKNLIDEIEGKRIDREYLISDLFDQGGASIALNLLGGFGGLYLTRKVQRLQRHTAWLLSGPLHLLSTKATMWGAGYSGKIWPKSGLEWGGELASSYAQAGLSLFIANRMFRVPAKVNKKIKIEIPNPTPVIPTSPFLWRGTKFIGKLAGLSGANLSMQLTLHYSQLKPMTPQGYPERISRWLFPRVQETRLAVTQLYDARTMYRQWTRTEDYRVFQQETMTKLFKKHELSLFLTKLSPSLVGEKRKKILSILLQIEGEGKLNSVLREQMLHQRGLGKWWWINKIFEQQKIPLQISSNSQLSLLAP